MTLRKLGFIMAETPKFPTTFSESFLYRILR
jgi:hypothetical protein